MTNKESGIELINEAQQIFEADVANALRNKNYNLVVRRSQEVVELALKGALKILGFDYPKVHHIGDIFARRAKEKMPVADEVLKKIEEISLWLSETRGPSFYLEIKFSENDALKAEADARFVIEEIKKIFGV